jgi:hypothetical protein
MSGTRGSGLADAVAGMAGATPPHGVCGLRFSAIAARDGVDRRVPPSGIPADNDDLSAYSAGAARAAGARRRSFSAIQRQTT